MKKRTEAATNPVVTRTKNFPVFNYFLIYYCIKFLNCFFATNFGERTCSSIAMFLPKKLKARKCSAVGLKAPKEQLNHFINWITKGGKSSFPVIYFSPLAGNFFPLFPLSSVGSRVLPHLAKNCLFGKL